MWYDCYANELAVIAADCVFGCRTGVGRSVQTTTKISINLFIQILNLRRLQLLAHPTHQQLLSLRADQTHHLYFVWISFMKLRLFLGFATLVVPTWLTTKQCYLPDSLHSRSTYATRYETMLPADSLHYFCLVFLTWLTTRECSLLAPLQSRFSNWLAARQYFLSEIEI